MRQLNRKKTEPVVTVNLAENLSETDITDLCEITEHMIRAGGGLGWIMPPVRQILERYWYGIMVVPERKLLIARLDGGVAGTVQLIEPSRHNQAQIFSASLAACFVAPWARGQDIGRGLMVAAENHAIDLGYSMLTLDVRATQKTAIDLYEDLGYIRWGENEHYAHIDGKFITGYYYKKMIGQPA